jgi:hypothetical protein
VIPKIVAVPVVPKIEAKLDDVNSWEDFEMVENLLKTLACG